MSLRSDLTKALRSWAGRRPTPREEAAALSPAPISPLGTTGKSRLSRIGRDDEHERRLQGAEAIRQFGIMGDDSATIGGALLLIRTMLSKVEVTFDAVPDVPESEPIAEWFQGAWLDMETSPAEVLGELASATQYGFAALELIYKVRGGPDTDDPAARSRYRDARWGWRDMAPRAQQTIEEWAWDGTRLAGAWQRDDEGSYWLPIERLIHLTMPASRRDPWGRSMLRSAWRAYYLRRMLEVSEAIGVERNLDGLPVMEVPPHMLAGGATPEEQQALQAYQTMLTRIRRDEQTAVIIPSETYNQGATGFKLRTLATGVDPSKADPIIQRYRADELIALLAEFLALGNSSQTGSFALADSQTNVLAEVLSSISSRMGEALQKQAVARLGRLNGFPAPLLPSIRFGDFQDADLAPLATLVSSLATSGLLTPDDKLEEHIRRLAGLPPIDSDTARLAPSDSEAPPIFG